MRAPEIPEVQDGYEQIKSIFHLIIQFLNRNAIFINAIFAEKYL
jgi:hypothetical protein